MNKQNVYLYIHKYINCVTMQCIKCQHKMGKGQVVWPISNVKEAIIFITCLPICPCNTSDQIAETLTQLQPNLCRFCLSWQPTMQKPGIIQLTSLFWRCNMDEMQMCDKNGSLTKNTAKGCAVRFPDVLHESRVKLFFSAYKQSGRAEMKVINRHFKTPHSLKHIPGVFGTGWNGQDKSPQQRPLHPGLLQVL